MRSRVVHDFGGGIIGLYLTLIASGTCLAQQCVGDSNGNGAVHHQRTDPRREHRAGRCPIERLSIRHTHRRPHRLLMSDENASPLRHDWPAWAPAAQAVGLFLFHGALPFGLSRLSYRYGWPAGHPSAWNVLGLLPVAAGIALIVWIIALHRREAVRHGLRSKDPLRAAALSHRRRTLPLQSQPDLSSIWRSGSDGHSSTGASPCCWGSSRFGCCSGSSSSPTRSAVSGARWARRDGSTARVPRWFGRSSR